MSAKRMSVLSLLLIGCLLSGMAPAANAPLSLTPASSQIPNGTPGSGDVLVPFEDWPNLQFDFQCSPDFND
jgi:hypothetical protein